MDFRLRYLVYSILLHVVLFVLLIASSFFQRPIEVEQVMTAVLLPASKPPPPKPPPPKPEPPKPKPPEPKPEPPKPPEPTPEERVADVLKKLDCDSIPDLKAEAKRRISAEAGVINKQIALMEAKCKKKEEDKKKLEEKQKLEELRKEKLEEEKQKKEDEKRQKDEDQQRKKDMQKMLDDEKRERELAEQQARQAALEASAAAEANAAANAIADKAIQEWAARMKEKVRRYWIQPPNMSDNLVAKVQISWLASGTVTKVRIVQSSGNAGYDDSVQRAILKSDPLPALNDARAYEKARDLILNFPAKELTR